jgi:hypothetical protein
VNVRRESTLDELLGLTSEDYDQMRSLNRLYLAKFL